MLAPLLRRMSSSSAAASGARLFLGIDSSTQGVKATIVDASLKPVFAAAVNYQADLPHYGTTDAVHKKPGHVVTQPTLMYLEALDLLFARMRERGAPLSGVVAVSGSGQQHGSVYFARGARAALRGLRGDAPLARALAGAFRVADSPIWMDSSTGAECAQIEAAAGGAAALARITGSRAYERFTGSQILKLAKTQPAAYAETERISLISSMMCSVLLGDYAPIDLSDGSGMNLLDIRAGAHGAWAAPVIAGLEAAGAAGVVAKLGPCAVASHTALGTLSPYFVARYGMSPACRVIAWSGDNPCSVAGLGLGTPGDIAVSLGTSDTIFGILAAPTPGVDGHIFVNPTDPASYMAMLCYKNGSLTRQRVRDAAAGASWPAFDAALLAPGTAGNGGRVGLFLDAPEITPSTPAAGDFRYELGAGGAPPRRVAAFGAPADDVRAVVQSKFMSMRVHAAAVGLAPVTRVIATGGASANAAILQTLADVFGAPVYTAAQPDAASLGAAYRAAHGFASASASAAGALVPFADILARGVPDAHGVAPGSAAGALALAAAPRADATAAYTALLKGYAQCEAAMIAEMTAAAGGKAKA